MPRRKKRSAWGSLTQVDAQTWRLRYWSAGPDGYRRRSKKAGRSPLVTYLFSVSPLKSSCCPLLSFADSRNAARVTSRFSGRFCCTLKSSDGITSIVNKDNCTSVVWQCWSVGPSLVCDLFLHADPTTIIWRVWAVVVDAIKSTSHARGIVVISSRQCPFLEREKAISPFVADCDSAPSITRIIVCILVIASGFHTSPDAIQPVCFRWYVGVQLVYAFFHGLCDRFRSGTFAARKRSARGQTFASYASYCSAFTSAYPSNLIAVFVKTEYRPLANSLTSKVFCPLTSLSMKHCVAEPTSARLLPSTFHVLYRCINSVSASASEFPNRSVATIAANWSNRGKPAKRLPRVILDKSASCWVFYFCHRILLGGRYA